MKKLAMLLLCVALVFSCTVIAFADPTPSQYIITVDPAQEDETYNAYKIFDVTYAAPVAPATEPSAYSYTVSSNSEWWSTLITPTTPDPNLDTTADEFVVDGLKFTKTNLTAADNGTVYIVTYEDDASLTSQQQTTARSEVAKTVADKLYANKANKTIAATDTGATSGGSTTATLDVGAPGYYFVTTSLGALCALNTAAPAVTVGDKNSVPTIDKKVSKDNSTWVDATNSTIGDDVYFKITVTDGDNTNNTLVVDDNMSAGLELKFDNGQHDITVHVGNTVVPATETVNGNTVTNYTLTVRDTSPYGFTITFSAAYMASIAADTEIVITYTAILNTDAEIVGNAGDTSTNPASDLRNYNTVDMEYSEQTATDTVYVDTYMFDIIKTDDSETTIIDGAEFDLYRSETGGTAIPLTLVSTDQTTGIKTYRVDPDASPSASIQAGKARIVGVGSDTFWLEETAAPAGYNQLDARQRYAQGTANNLAVLADNYTTYDSGGVMVKNVSGGSLPSTGGIGTYLFYGIGAILVVGAVVVLVSKKRMHAYGE